MLALKKNDTVCQFLGNFKYLVAETHDTENSVYKGLEGHLWDGTGDIQSTDFFASGRRKPHLQPLRFHKVLSAHFHTHTPNNADD